MKINRKLSVILAVLLAFNVPFDYSMATPAVDISFETTTDGMTIVDGSVVTGEITVPTEDFEWKVSPNGSKMLQASPDASATYETVKSALGFSAEGDTYLTTQFPQITNNGYFYFEREFAANETFTMAWQYISVDYVPFNDGSIISFVNTGDASNKPLIDGVRADVSILGATVPGTGNYSTGSYGATGWQTVTLKSANAGTYRIGFAIFNLDDTALSPILFIDDAAGTTLKDGVPFGPIPKDENAPPPAGEVEASSNADLSALTLSSGTLAPSFDGAVTSYTSEVSNVTTSMIVTPVAADAGATITVNGVAVTSGQASSEIPLNEGENTITIVVTAEDETVKTYTIVITRGDSEPTTEPPTEPPTEPTTEPPLTPDPVPLPDPTPAPSSLPVVVIVNGEPQAAGTETKTVENQQTVVNVVVNPDVIEKRIDEIAKDPNQNNIIQVNVQDTSADVARVELTGDIIKKLEDKTFSVSVVRDDVAYIIPAQEFTIDAVATALGISENDLVDIKIDIQISKVSPEVIASYEAIAKENGTEIVFPPISFDIVAKAKDQNGVETSVDISRFNDYVERVLELPDSIDPSKITTGIVFNADGTYNHVPTEVYQENGKWYARLNSLTNSTYSIIWNPLTIASVDKHWSKDIVNDMASRLVVFNVDTFNPDLAMTRGDFAEYMVRALGLYRSETKAEAVFEDMSIDQLNSAGIYLASEYGLITGYDDGTFRESDFITREEAMVILSRAMDIAKLAGTKTESTFVYADLTSASKWSLEAVKAVLKTHIFDDNDSSILNPDGEITYAEAAQIIRNFLIESGLINE